MSWARHNSEKYDEIIRKGMLHYLDQLLMRGGFDTPGQWIEGYEALLEVIQYEPSTRSLYDALMQLASQDILDSEADYYGGLIDQAKERFDA